MNKAEEILCKVTHKDKFGDVSILIHVDYVFQAMSEYARLAFETGRIYGREEGLFDNGILKRYECTAPDFKDWEEENNGK